MKKQKSNNSDLLALLDKQYKTNLLLLKLVSSLTVQVDNLAHQLQEQKELIASLIVDIPLEEETV